MPIKTGSGGLKYPLPSQSQIGASQAAASASAGGSASASAFGDRMRLIGQGRQLRYNAMQSEMDREFKAEQSFYDREHQMGAQLESQGFRDYLQGQQFKQQSDLQLQSQDWRAQQEQLGRDFQGQQAQLGRDFQTGRDKQLDQYDREKFERGRDAQIEAGIQTGKIVLPDESQRQLKKLEADRANFKPDTPAAQAEWDQKYAAEKRRLMRTATTPGGPTITGQAIARIKHKDENTGAYYDQQIPGVTKPYELQPDGVTFAPADMQVRAEKAAQQKEQQKAAQKQQQAEAQWVAKRAAEANRQASAWNKAHKDDEGFEPKQGSDLLQQAEDELVLKGVNKPLPAQAPAAPAGNSPAAPAVAPPVVPPTAPPVAPPVAQAPPQQRPAQAIPAGAPAGSAWLDENTLQYPDGRQFRKKGTPPPGAPTHHVGITDKPAGYKPPVRAPKKKQGEGRVVPYQG